MDIIIEKILDEALKATEKYASSKESSHSLEHNCLKDNSIVHFNNVKNLAESSTMIPTKVCKDIKSIQLNDNYYSIIVKILIRNNLL